MARLETQGIFNASVTGTELGESRNGTPQMIVDFNTQEGDISAWLYLSEAAFPYSLKSLQEAFKFNGDFEKLDQLVGKACRITVEAEEDPNGDSRLRVKWINAPRVELEAEDKHQLARRLSQRAREGTTGTAKDPF